MTRTQFDRLESCMQVHMKDSAHDREHVRRVLYTALDIAKTEPEADLDILIPACMLHDIGRERQLKNPQLCHAREGGSMAYQWLQDNGWTEESAKRISDCIVTHRYRSGHPPASVEAQILFDADKLDVAGALGIARTLFYQSAVNDPLYTVSEDGLPVDGAEGEPSFFREYHFKLEQIYDKFYTQKASELAKERQQAAVSFYQSLRDEIIPSYQSGLQDLEGLLTKE